MLSYKMLSITNVVMAFSVGVLFGELFRKKVGNENDRKFLKYARLIWLFGSVGLFIWLLFNKELFHWNFDIATGEKVDHYSTYGRCISKTVIAMVSNVVSCIIARKRIFDAKSSRGE